MHTAGELTRVQLADGVYLHLHSIGLYKTIRVDICLSTPLCAPRHSLMALSSRLLARGTHQLPNVQSLNRFIDDLYGAHYSVQVDRLGEYQFVHLCLEVIDDNFLGEKGILARGLTFLRDVLRDGCGFRPDYLEREKHRLARQIADGFNDKLGYAQRRCSEEMCRGEPIGLSPLGNPADFAAVQADELWAFHRERTATDRLDLFISGDLHLEQIRPLMESLFTWERAASQPQRQPSRPRIAGLRREIFECQEVREAKMVLGYRTQVAYGANDYPALVLLNLIFGGDGPSRLFKHLREEEGLCYYIASHIEALSGLLFVAAGIEATAYPKVRDKVEQEFQTLRSGAFDLGEIEAARRLLRARLLGLTEDREGFFRYQLREGLTGGSQSPQALWQRIEQVGVEELAHVADGIAADTAFLLHGT
ncbi:MAG: pitrilysin family protein [Gemmatimonadetes bacterium]|nr:pitrilysin family protein [Gemmatimonadota bacterium]MDE2733422.1 pitrilysin family protein [Gemmatimonadota bacterium]